MLGIFLEFLKAINWNSKSLEIAGHDHRKVILETSQVFEIPRHPGSQGHRIFWVAAGAVQGLRGSCPLYKHRKKSVEKTIILGAYACQNEATQFIIWLWHVVEGTEKKIPFFFATIRGDRNMPLSSLSRFFSRDTWPLLP